MLPAVHHITSLAITQLHEKYHHCGQDQILVAIREEF